MKGGVGRAGRAVGIKKNGEREEKAAWASDHEAALHHHQPAESIKEPPWALCSTVLMTSLRPISPAKCSSWTSARARRGGGCLRGEAQLWERVCVCVCGEMRVTSYECRRLCPTGSVDSSALPAAPCPPPLPHPPHRARPRRKRTGGTGGTAGATVDLTFR